MTLDEGPAALVILRDALPSIARVVGVPASLALLGLADGAEECQLLMADPFVPNLRDDVGETRNLAQVEVDVRDRLYARLKMWRESVEAKIPETNPDWPSI
jgi:hypothetical protein